MHIRNIILTISVGLLLLLGCSSNAQNIPKELYGNWKGTTSTRSNGTAYGKGPNASLTKQNSYNFRITKDGWLTSDMGLREKFVYYQRDSAFWMKGQHFFKVEKLTKDSLTLRLYVYTDKAAANKITPETFHQKLKYVKIGE
jgi:hypothetical protein